MPMVSPIVGPRIGQPQPTMLTLWRVGWVSWALLDGKMTGQ